MSLDVGPHTLGHLLASPPQRDQVLAATLREIGEGRPSVVVAADTTSIWFASLLAQRQMVPMAYLRSQQKTHGMKRQLEGVLPSEGDATLVIECIGDGLALYRSIRILEQSGLSVRVCVVLTEDVSDRDRMGRPGPRWLSLERISEKAERLANQPSTAAPIPSLSTDEAPGRVAEVLLDIGAVTIDYVEPYTYVSGIRSPIYTDNRRLISY